MGTYFTTGGRQRIWWAICAMTLLGRNAIVAKDLDFNRDIRPILSNNCFACHGPDSAAREADLRLDREEDAKAIRQGHAAIVPGKVEESELVARITNSDEYERMPPANTGKKLKPEEIALM